VRCDVIDCGTDDAVALTHALARADLAIDAMYGTGFRGVLAGTAAQLAAWSQSAVIPVLAVDIPSGVDGATGSAEGPSVRATATVTFQAYKPGLCFAVGRSAAGNVRVVDLGIALAPIAPSVHLIAGSDVAAWLPMPSATAHKWMHAVYVVGGSSGMIGAPRLVSHAAMRAGAGMVWCGVPGDAVREVGGTEVIARSLAATPDGTALDATAVDGILSAAKRFGAMVIGPGLGGHARTVAAVQQLVAEAPVPLVLDADGLNAIAGDLAPLRVRALQAHVPTVLTPHDGEYARLTGRLPDADRIASARALAEETRTVVLLKGSTTTIAAPDGRVLLAMRGGPELATAGTGDALSGIIGAFLARGVPAFEAAAAGAYVHGQAGRRVGSGLVASDLLSAIPRTLAELSETGV